jgi:hypothetical protein
MQVVAVYPFFETFKIALKGSISGYFDIDCWSTLKKRNNVVVY